MTKTSTRTLTPIRRRSRGADISKSIFVASAVVFVAACGSSTGTTAGGVAPTTSHVAVARHAVANAVHDMAAMNTTPITDLNGHTITGVKAHDVMAEMGPDKPLDKATHARLQHELLVARAVAMKYPTVAAATAAGYHLVGGGFGPGSGAHYIGGFFMSFDPAKPLALIYDGIHPTSVMVGLMYYSMSPTAPAGFAGPNDHWHRHSGVCNGKEGVLFPPDSSVTLDQCTKAGGSYMAITGWMVHAWVVPGWDSPGGVFSHENPDLACADGTFHTDAIGRCEGS